MRITVISAFGVLPLGAGGASIQCKEFCSTFNKKGHEIILVVPTSNTQFDYKFYSKVVPVRYTNIPGLKQFSMAAYSLVYSIFNRSFEKSDAIVLYGMNLGLLPSILRCKAPLVLRIPDVDFELSGIGINSQEKIRRLLLRTYYSLLNRKASALVFPSKFSAETFRRYFKNNVRVHATIPNFISSIFSSNSSNPFSKANISLIYVGTLSRRKGVHLLINAYRRLVKEQNNVHLILLGDGPLRHSIEEISIIDGIQSKLQLPGNVSLEVVSKKLQESDIFILPSYIEGQSNSLLQALSSGLIVVASDIKPNKEVIINGSNGVLFKTGSSEDLFLTLKELLKNPERSLCLAESAKKITHSKNGRENIYSLWQSVFSKLYN